MSIFDRRSLIELCYRKLPGFFHYILTSFRGKFIKIFERIIIGINLTIINIIGKYFIIPKIISFGLRLVELRLINIRM